jgi:hypothetical protein
MKYFIVRDTFNGPAVLAKYRDRKRAENKAEKASSESLLNCCPAYVVTEEEYNKRYIKK